MLFAKEAFKLEDGVDCAVAFLQQELKNEALIFIQGGEIGATTEMGEFLFHIVIELGQQGVLTINEDQPDGGGQENVMDGQKFQLVTVGLEITVLPEPTQNILKGVEDLYIPSAVLVNSGTALPMANKQGLFASLST